MVAKVLRSGFADSYSPARVPRDMVELAYRKYVKRYVHAELVRVSHVIATVPEKATQKEHKASLKIARKIHKLVSSTPMDKSKFVGLKDTFDVGDSKVLLHSETLTTQLRGRTVRAFADAAFAMTKEGQISPVVKSRFGYHILRMIKRIPRRNDSFKEAEAEIRVSILEMTRPVAFQRWMNELAKKIPIAVKWDVFEAALGEVKTKAK